MIKRKDKKMILKKIGTKMLAFLMTMTTVCTVTSMCRINKAEASELYVSSNTQKSNYSMIFKAAAYTGGTKTASGMPTKRDPKGLSTVAVDPSVIPYGTALYIEGYGYAVAADCGSAIKGKTVDLYFNSYAECCNWGIKYVKVTVLGNSGTV